MKTMVKKGYIGMEQWQNFHSSLLISGMHGTVLGDGHATAIPFRFSVCISPYSYIVYTNVYRVRFWFCCRGGDKSQDLLYFTV